MAQMNPQSATVLHSFFSRVRDLYYKFRFSRKSSAYWENRYRTGGNSGVGSYGEVAQFKAEVINRLIDSYNIQSATELGCGDGNQLGMFRFPRYIGMDISGNAVSICQRNYAHDNTKSFVQYRPAEIPLEPYRSEMALSLDVIYHLIEESLFDRYMRDLFSLARQFVVIYSSDSEGNDGLIPQYKNRTFTRWIGENVEGWDLVERINNPHTNLSGADFFIYRAKSS